MTYDCMRTGWSVLTYACYSIFVYGKLLYPNMELVLTLSGDVETM